MSKNLRKHWVKMIYWTPSYLLLKGWASNKAINISTEWKPHSQATIREAVTVNAIKMHFSCQINDKFILMAVAQISGSFLI